jgi:ATP-dependent DNA ligase
MVKRRFCKPLVGSSNLSPGTSLIRRHGALVSAVLCAFDLLELDGRGLRREPIEERKKLTTKGVGSEKSL